MKAVTIEAAFNECFTDRYNTVLLGGAEEPLYEPADDVHRIWYRSDYASSALHEAAHWLIAGPARRRVRDYGYWYEHERDADTQRRFELAEKRVQALECILSEAAGVDFRVSCDNFDESTLDLERFRGEVREEVRGWLERGLPPRAARFERALTERSAQ